MRRSHRRPKIPIPSALAVLAFLGSLPLTAIDGITPPSSY